MIHFFCKCFILVHYSIWFNFIEKSFSIYSLLPFLSFLILIFCYFFSFLVLGRCYLFCFFVHTSTFAVRETAEGKTTKIFQFRNFVLLFFEVILLENLF